MARINPFLMHLRRLNRTRMLEAHLRIPDPAFGELITTARIERAHVVAYDGTNERVLMTR